MQEITIYDHMYVYIKKKTIQAALDFCTVLYNSARCLHDAHLNAYAQLRCEAHLVMSGVDDPYTARSALCGSLMHATDVGRNEA